MSSTVHKRHLGLRDAVAGLSRAAVGYQSSVFQKDNAAFDMTVNLARHWNNKVSIGTPHIPPTFQL